MRVVAHRREALLCRTPTTTPKLYWQAVPQVVVARHVTCQRARGTVVTPPYCPAPAVHSPCDGVHPAQPDQLVHVLEHGHAHHHAACVRRRTEGQLGLTLLSDVGQARQACAQRCCALFRTRGASVQRTTDRPSCGHACHEALVSHPHAPTSIQEQQHTAVTLAPTVCRDAVDSLHSLAKADARIVRRVVRRGRNVHEINLALGVLPAMFNECGS